MPFRPLPLLIVLLAAGLLACERTPTKLLEKPPLRPPSDATVAVSARSLNAMASVVRPIAGQLLAEPLARAEESLEFDPTAPTQWQDRGAEPDGSALLFCDQAACAFRPTGSWFTGELPARLGDDVWVVADRRDRVLVVGPESTEALQSALARWRDPAETSAPPQIAEGADAAGIVNPDPLLAQWQPTDARARALVGRVARQTNALSFQVTAGPDTLDVSIAVEQQPDEPRFVDELGTPRSDLPRIAGLVDDGVLGVARISADPEVLWTLGRSLLSADQRTDLDQFLDSLHAEAALDLETTLLQNVTGHIVVVAYGLEPSETSVPADWLMLRRTREAVLIPIADPLAVRRLLDAWTQLSEGRLHVQETTGDRLQWAWLDEGELRWSVIVGDDFVLFVDSSVASTHARRWESKPAPLSNGLVRRGVDDLLAGTARSGLYLDLAALQALFGERFRQWFPQMRSVTLTEDGEETRLRIALHQDN